MTTFKSQASASIRHRCGHEATRQIKQYNPFKKKYQTILDLAYLERMRAPAVMIEKTREALEKATPKTLAYWQEQDCPKCWKSSLGTQPA